jgi:hypothetical protein
MAKTKKLFSKEALQDLVGGQSDTLVEVQNALADTSRWSVHYDLVFREIATGKLYETSYSCGATESQDESPFEYEGDEIACVEVKAVEKTVTVYEPV